MGLRLQIKYFYKNNKKTKKIKKQNLFILK